MTVWLLASCAADRTANRLAGTTISELTAYEKTLEDKINAEEGFYREQAGKLNELQGYLVLPKAKTRKERGAGESAASVMSAEELLGYQMVLEQLESDVQNANEVKLAAELAQRETAAREAASAAEQRAAEAQAERLALPAAATKAEKEAADKRARELGAGAAEKRRAADGLTQARALVREVTPEQLKKAVEHLEAHAGKLASVESREAAVKLLAQTQPAAAELAMDDEEVTRRVRTSLPYLRVTMAAEREAILAVDKVLVQGTPAARTALVNFMTDGVVNDGAALEKAVLARQQMEAEVTKNLAKLDAGKGSLANAREALTKVRTKKKFFEKIKDLLDFGREARSLYEESQKPKS